MFSVKQQAFDIDEFQENDNKKTRERVKNALKRRTKVIRRSVQQKAGAVMGIAFFPTNLIRVKTLNNTLIAIKSRAIECIERALCTAIEKLVTFFATRPSSTYHNSAIQH